MCSGLRAARRRAFLLVLTGLVAGCATLGTPTQTISVVPDAAFTAEGRLSARHASDAVSAGFRWKHSPTHDELSLSTPLGQTVAELSGDAAAHVVRVHLASGETLQAQDWPTLTSRALGFPLPVTGLASWIRGGPHPGTLYRAEVDERGRATLLLQDGWEIAFDYADDTVSTPTRIRMTFPDVEVRIAIGAIGPG